MARRRVRLAGAAAFTLIATTAVACLGGCSIVSDLATPESSRTIVIPGTNALTTESSVDSTSVDPSAQEERDSAPGDWDDWSYGHIVNVAPRADAERFHRGAKTQRDPLTDSSGFHFSTPDRTVQCSTGANGTGTLSCVSDKVEGAPAPPRGTPASCQWDAHMATLGAAGAASGACANLYPVMTRSTILPFNRTLAAGRFKCLNSVDGLFCLQSTDSGFAITKDGYREIRADQRAPRTMRGPAPDDDSSSNAPAPTQSGAVEPSITPTS
ncbi:hypothetical protein [Gordonia sp. (in: high G+C Gram-positive bacteria)]|uniref:hypothetical protein n=1 Tax=Gordonia sp. (in: high G+C Gram-positive bacteria) TaxID=84139 RepID=UPI0039E450FC